MEDVNTNDHQFWEWGMTAPKLTAKFAVHLQNNLQIEKINKILFSQMREQDAFAETFS